VVKAPLCPYCGKRSKQMLGKDALEGDIGEQRKDLLNKQCYVCRDCDARVWCHEHNGSPLGRLANRHCRLLRKICHRLFDELWQGGRVSRNEAYAWLGQQLGLTRRQCHFGLFDESMCQRAIDVLEQEKALRA
jgi:hypothetical protein